MVWGAISYNSFFDLFFSSEKQNSKVNCNVLEEGLISFPENTVGDTFMFQQDNALTHNSNYTMDSLDANDVYMLSWLANPLI